MVGILQEAAWESEMSGKRATSTAVIERDDQPALGDIIPRINALCELDAGWNGYDAVSPRSEAIAAARHWIRIMFEDAAATPYAWADPLVTASAEGDVVFEWWNGPRKLTVYVSGDSVEYVKAWGPNITEEMSDGEIRSASDRRALWSWLAG